MALYGAMHECGHGLYEAGIAPALQRTPLGTIRSQRDPRVAEPAMGEHGRAQPRASPTALDAGRR